MCVCVCNLCGSSEINSLSLSLSLLVSLFPSQCNQTAQRRDPPAWTRTTAVRTSVGKHRRVASPASVDLDSSSPVTWRTANVSRVNLKPLLHRPQPHLTSVKSTHTHTTRIYRLLMKRWSGLETCRWLIIALIPQTPCCRFEAAYWHLHCITKPWLIFWVVLIKKNMFIK